MEKYWKAELSDGTSLKLNTLLLSSYTLLKRGRHGISCQETTIIVIAEPKLTPAHFFPLTLLQRNNGNHHHKKFVSFA